MRLVMDDESHLLGPRGQGTLHAVASGNAHTKSIGAGGF